MKELEDLKLLLEKGSLPQKIDAIRKLSEVEGISNINIFRTNLADKSWHIRLAAAQALAKVLGKEAKPELTILLQDKAYGVREDVKKLIDQYCE